jgi:hypothetical protein
MIKHELQTILRKINLDLFLGIKNFSLSKIFIKEAKEILK